MPIPKRAPILVLGASLLAAGLFAVFHSSSPAIEPVRAQPTEARTSVPDTSALPPGHPPIGAPNGATPPMRDEKEAPALTWTPPPAWNVSPSQSAMRIATYRIPRAPGDTEDTELSVVRAGGSPEANIERWLGQFDKAGKDTRTTRTIQGMPVTVVEVQGTFLGGGMAMGGAPSSHPGWALLAAIVPTPGSAYFFKMTGPAKSVVAARPAFDALLTSLTPASTP
jgi:hypothetical protein